MQPIKSFRSKNELVYQTIRDAILSSELRPGTRLVIDELAATLEVSQIPVREALRQLEADGFVIIKPYTGATVTSVQVSQVYEIFGLLESMEVISSQRVCEIATEGQLRQLDSMLRQMDCLLDDPHQWSKENVRFHQMICDYADMPLVKMMMQKVSDHWKRLHNLYLKDVFVPRVAIAQKDHWAIYEAICSRDPDRVEQVVREHNRAALEAYTRFLNQSAG